MPLYETCIYKSIFMENLHSTLENHDKRKSLAHQIFPCLWYFAAYSLSNNYKTHIWLFSVIVWDTIVSSNLLWISECMSIAKYCNHASSCTYVSSHIGGQV